LPAAADPTEDDPLAPPLEHVEQHAYHPLEVNRIEVVTSASANDVTVSLTGVSATGSIGSFTIA
jgi:hypothetical protein